MGLLLGFLLLCHLLGLLCGKGYREEEVSVLGLKRCGCCWHGHLLVGVALGMLSFSTGLPSCLWWVSKGRCFIYGSTDLLSWGDAADALAPCCPFIMEQM